VDDPPQIHRREFKNDRKSTANPPQSDGANFGGGREAID